MNYLKADLPGLITAAESVANEAKGTFGRLTPAQLNWKPSAERWSVAQCFDHLLASNRGFLPIVDSVLAGRKQTFWQSVPVLPGFWGKLLIKSLDSPAASVITYSLMDAYRVIVVHEARHFQQAERVTEESGFPA